MTEPHPEDTHPPGYRVEESDLAEADREAAFLWLMSLHGPDYADEWHKGLLSEIRQLVAFPGPLSHPMVRPATQQHPEVRRMLYYGPKGRRSRTATRYRVLFTVIEAAEDEDEAVIRVLRILHGAQAVPEEGGG